MKIFSNIYKYNLWGFGSGTGSLKFNNQKYIDFMNDFLKNHTDVSSIIDLGCGDWQLHKHINLNNHPGFEKAVLIKALNHTSFSALFD